MCRNFELPNLRIVSLLQCAWLHPTVHVVHSEHLPAVHLPACPVHLPACRVRFAAWQAEARARARLQRLDAAGAPQ